MQRENKATLNISASVLQNDALTSFAFGPLKETPRSSDDRWKANKSIWREEGFGILKIQSRTTSCRHVRWTLVLNLLWIPGKS